jgi:hypothetical protein
LLALSQHLRWFVLASGELDELDLWAAAMLMLVRSSVAATNATLVLKDPFSDEFECTLWIAKLGVA